MAFNKEFDEVFRAKEVEMGRINDRNARITKILGDLTLEEQIKNVDWSSEEKPEDNLVVKDSEVIYDGIVRVVWHVFQKFLIANSNS